MAISALSLMRTATYRMKSILSRRIFKDCSGCRFTSYDHDGKTNVSILNNEIGSGIMIDSYSQMGFRLNNGMLVLGPVAIFPKTVLSWNVGGVKEINEESLSLFCCLEPKIDILVLGVGDYCEFLQFDKKLAQFLRSNRINVEVLSTEQACSTFNFLNAEKRYVAGAFIPPSSVRVTEDDVARTQLLVKKSLTSK